MPQNYLRTKIAQVGDGLNGFGVGNARRAIGRDASLRILVKGSVPHNGT